MLGDPSAVGAGGLSWAEADRSPRTPSLFTEPLHPSSRRRDWLRCLVVTRSYTTAGNSLMRAALRPKRVITSGDELLRHQRSRALGRSDVLRGNGISLAKSCCVRARASRSVRICQPRSAAWDAAGSSCLGGRPPWRKPCWRSLWPECRSMPTTSFGFRFPRACAQTQWPGLLAWTHTDSSPGGWSSMATMPLWGERVRFDQWSTRRAAW